MNAMSVRIIKPSGVAAAWGEIRPMLERSLRLNDLPDAETADDIFGLIMSGRMDAWSVDEKLILLTQFQRKGKRVSFWIVHMFGNAGGALMSMVHDNIGTFEQLARKVGCSHIRMTARRGFARLLPDYTMRADNDNGALVELRKAL